MVTSFATILVVDDEPDLRTLYELTLLREGYRVETAGTLAEAFAAADPYAFAEVFASTTVEPFRLVFKDGAKVG